MSKPTSTSPTKTPLNPPRAPSPPTFAVILPTPELWDPSLDALTGRTLRAYKLVCAYADESHGGRRWDAAGIRTVQQAGKHIEEDVDVLEKWKAYANDLDEQDRVDVAEDAKRVGALCWDVLDTIEKTERKDVMRKRRGKKKKRDLGMRIKGAGERAKSNSNSNSTSKHTHNNNNITRFPFLSPTTKKRRLSHSPSPPAPERNYLTSKSKKRKLATKPPVDPNKVAGRLGKHVLHL